MNRHKNPEIFQKRFYNKSYFEGWYYKLVTADRKNTICFIPGVSYGEIGAKSFIQCLHLNQKHELKAYNIDYPIDSFHSSCNPFYVVVDNSKFSLTNISLDFNYPELKVNGNINLENLTPIKTSIVSPNIMGFFSYIPFMECNHGVISMSHDLNGYLRVNEEDMDFSKGKGYLEKDWGRSFPNSYVWIQSNHFPDKTVGIFCSVAKIPFFGGSFNGFICNLIHQGREYRFATYNNSKLILNNRSNDKVHLKLANKRYSLDIIGEVVLSKKLFAPKMGLMDRKIKEGLSGKVEIQLKDNNNNIILEAESNHCGIEIV